jgi:spermidine synthase
MIEIDEMMIQIAREYLLFFNDYSDFVGVMPNCFDDERADIITRDAKEWLMENYGPRVESVPDEEKFQVIILDAINPEEDNANSKGLFISNWTFIQIRFLLVFPC